MMTVTMVWLLQWGAVMYIAYARSDVRGFMARLRAAVAQPVVWMLAGGCAAFLYAGTHAARSYDYRGTVMAGVSFVAELIFLIATLLILIFRRAGGADTTFGSARFATVDHANAHGLIGDKGIRLGYFRHPDNSRPERPVPLHYTGKRHILTFAPTRGGKGVAAIIPNLLSYGGSCLVIDPKGELARTTYDQRARTGKVFVLDPWGITGKPKARYNPLASLRADSPNLIDDAALIGEALTIPETQGNGKHFSEQAAAVVKDFVLHLVTSRTESQTLGRLRDILTMAPRDLAKIGAAMSKSPYAAVRSGSAQLIGKSETERAGVLSTAQRNTHFLDSPALRESLAGHDFRFADLKGKVPVTIYLCLPVERLASHNRWLRLIIAQAISELARTPAQPAQPVLFLLDEFAQLGHMPIIEEAYGLMGGMGLMMHAILQDMSQLKRLYGEGWQTFVANAGVTQVFNTRDLFTAQYVSDLIGKTTTTMRSTSTSTSDGKNGGSSSSVSLAPTQRSLLFPDELMRMDREAQVLFVENADPVLATKIVWYDDPAYRHLGTRDPGAPVLDIVPQPVPDPLRLTYAPARPEPHRAAA